MLVFQCVVAFEEPAFLAEFVAVGGPVEVKKIGEYGRNGRWRLQECQRQPDASGRYLLCGGPPECVLAEGVGMVADVGEAGRRVTPRGAAGLTKHLIY